MKVIDEALEEMLGRSASVATLSERVAKLEERVATLEGQVSILASTTRSLMESVTQLTRISVANKNTTDEICEFLTNANSNLSDEDDGDDGLASDEQLEASDEAKKVWN